MAENLPTSVHLLSAESQAALACAKERGDTITACHTKPERLSAASIKTMDPERLNLTGGGADF